MKTFVKFVLITLALFVITDVVIIVIALNI